MKSWFAMRFHQIDSQRPKSLKTTNANRCKHDPSMDRESHFSDYTVITWRAKCSLFVSVYHKAITSELVQIDDKSLVFSLKMLIPLFYCCFHPYMSVVIQLTQCKRPQGVQLRTYPKHITTANYIFFKICSKWAL